jgi:hypothetical protein
LGVEFDYSIAYQYSGLVSIKATMNDFTPGNAFKPTDLTVEDTKQKAKFSSIEIQVKF